MHRTATLPAPPHASYEGDLVLWAEGRARLLTWKCRSASRRAAIFEQRERIARTIRRFPGLRGRPSEVFAECRHPARLLASKGTGTGSTLFPAIPPFTPAQALGPEFLPKRPDLDDQTG